MQRGSAMMAMYHDDPETVPLDRLRSDAAVVIPDGMPVPAGLVEQHLAAGQYACTLYIGPYEQIGDAWARASSESGCQRVVISSGSGPKLRAIPQQPGNAAPAELALRSVFRSREQLTLSHFSSSRGLVSAVTYEPGRQPARCE